MAKKLTATAQRAPLTRERVLDAAMALADEGGLEAVSMRRVAQALGVEAMSLYRYVANKDALLDGLVERIFEQLEPAPLHAHWSEALRGQAQAMRCILLKHRWAAGLIESRLYSGPRRLKLYEATIAALVRAGLTLEQTYRAQLTLDGYIYGFVLQEVSWSFAPDERAQTVDMLRPDIDPATHPHLTAMMDLVAAQAAQQAAAGVTPSNDQDFLFGLDLILGALARLSSAPRA